MSPGPGLSKQVVHVSYLRRVAGLHHDRFLCPINTAVGLYYEGSEFDSNHIKSREMMPDGCLWKWPWPPRRALVRAPEVRIGDGSKARPSICQQLGTTALPDPET